VGSILNADGGKLVTINIGKMEFATFRKMELQLSEKCLAKNTGAMQRYFVS